MKMRTGAPVMAHQRRRMAVDCHRPRDQRGTSREWGEQLEAALSGLSLGDAKAKRPAR